MKAVLMSIQPKWCELIASGKKTVEVRKTKPKLDVPFKVYIYETQGRTETPFVDEEGHHIFKGRGQVIGEFVCDKVFEICIEVSTPAILHPLPLPCICLTDNEVMQYLGNGKEGYGWHISDLVIYDEPRGLSEFKRWVDRSKGQRYHEDMLYLQTPPQSWCYVEEVEG
jgi:predicted transcriptional regulator